MDLPPGFDVLLGMDWLQENDIWINPRRKQLLRSKGPDNDALHVCLTELGSTDTSSTDSSSDCPHTELPGAPPKPHRGTDKILPYGIYSMSADSKDQNEI